MINFDEMIDKHLKRESKAKTIGRYYPSEVGTCIRKVWFSYKKPKDTDPATLKIFHAGNILHDFVTDVLKSEKNTDIELIGTEVPFKVEVEDFLISGRIDNMILIKDRNEKVVVEVKSTKNLDYLKEPNQSYVTQLQLYLHSLGLKKGVLLYVQKDNLKSKSFNVEYDETEANRILARFKKLHHHLKNDIMPDAEAKIYEELKWLCNYCDYSEECRECGGD
ncbi:MAG: PD-(D/E)XK nuclease family protein [Nanoarchaeota archaeon]